MNRRFIKEETLMTNIKTFKWQIKINLTSNQSNVNSNESEVFPLPLNWQKSKRLLISTVG